MPKTVRLNNISPERHLTERAGITKKTLSHRNSPKGIVKEEGSFSEIFSDIFTDEDHIFKTSEQTSPKKLSQLTPIPTKSLSHRDSPKRMVKNDNPQIAFDLNRINTTQASLSYLSALVDITTKTQAVTEKQFKNEKPCPQTFHQTLEEKTVSFELFKTISKENEQHCERTKMIQNKGMTQEIPPNIRLKSTKGHKSIEYKGWNFKIHFINKKNKNAPHFHCTEKIAQKHFTVEAEQLTPLENSKSANLMTRSFSLVDGKIKNTSRLLSRLNAKASWDYSEAIQFEGQNILYGIEIP